MSGPGSDTASFKEDWLARAEASEPTAPGLVLVVDGHAERAAVLERLLRRQGYQTRVAANLGQAIGAFHDTPSPALVFIGLASGDPGGFETIRAIKCASRDQESVSLVLMADRFDEDMLANSIDAGGDDFILGPIDSTVLKARLLVVERARRLRRTMGERKRALSELLEWEREEESLAERVLSRAVRNRNVLMDRLSLMYRPAAVFSGDLVLTQHLPDGGVRILVADFTGHGLAAAVGALPIADAFHAMTRKGVDDARVLEEFNRKLHQLLPADRFMAACLISLPGDGGALRWWNGGMPSAWLRTEAGLVELAAHALPLGILPELPECDTPRRHQARPGDRLLLMTDGLLEAEDRQGRMFLHAGLEDILRDWRYDTSLLPHLTQCFDAHCAGSEQADDIAVLEIPLDPALFARRAPASDPLDQAVARAAASPDAAPARTSELPPLAFQEPRSDPPCERPNVARGIALVVDDERINLRLLSRMLQQEGFLTHAASSGEEALEYLETGERPDIIFMDVVMPGLNGIETTRAIKARLGEHFVPVVFLSALRDEDTMMDCIRVGGDDFLSKPFNFSVLKSRIHSMERTRDMQRCILAANRSLLDLLERRQQEQRLAERVFSGAIRNRNVALDRLGLLQRSAATFNGDLLLTQSLPDGGLRILLADITGHGLGATIGALPVAEAFHAMTLKGVSDDEVLAEINRKLHQLLPADRFMAACLISISRQGLDLRWWNGGMPSAWVMRPQGLLELTSHALPLGVLPALPEGETSRRLALSPGDGLLLCTDGLLMARDSNGVPFGESRLRELLARWEPGRRLLPELSAALAAHCESAEQPDDIAVLEIPITDALFASSLEFGDAPEV